MTTPEPKYPDGPFTVKGNPLHLVDGAGKRLHLPTACAMLNERREVEGLEKLGWLYSWAKAVFEGFHSKPSTDKKTERNRKQKIKDFAECRQTLKDLGVEVD